MSNASVAEAGRMATLEDAAGCPAETVLALLAGRWRPMVIWHLLRGEMRFNALQRALGPITHRTLARTLREMEDDGLVLRRDHGTIPPRVDYRLTPKGLSLAPVLAAMEQWALMQGSTAG